MTGASSVRLGGAGAARTIGAGGPPFGTPCPRDDLAGRLVRMGLLCSVFALGLLALALAVVGLATAR